MEFLNKGEIMKGYVIKNKEGLYYGTFDWTTNIAEAIIYPDDKVVYDENKGEYLVEVEIIEKERINRPDCIVETIPFGDIAKQQTLIDFYKQQGYMVEKGATNIESMTVKLVFRKIKKGEQ